MDAVISTSLNRGTCAAFAGVILALAPATVDGGYRVGVALVEEPTFSPFLGSGMPGDGPTIYPYSYDGASPFAANGALAGVSDAQLLTAVVDTVQDMFRRADIGLPGRMLHIHVVPGTIAPEAGTSHHIGSSGFNPPPSVYGIAELDAANSRPDLDPLLAEYYPANHLSITLADAIAALPVSYTTFDQVVNALAGTVAHEIAHTIGVSNHDPGTSVNGVYSVMASGATDMPASARLERREFLNIANTQPGGMSVTDVLLSKASTTATTDFNFDGLTNVADRAIYLANVGSMNVTVTRGDATGDHIVDVRDRAAYLQAVSQYQDSAGDAAAAAAAVLPSVLYDMNTGRLVLDASMGGDINAFLIAQPAPLHSVSDPDGGRGAEWRTFYSDGNQNWESLQFDYSGSLTAGVWELGLLPPGLTADMFGAATFVTSSGELLSTDVMVVPEPSVISSLVLAISLLRRRRT